MRADIQVAVDKLFSTSPLRFFGIFEQQRYETLTFAALTKDGQHAHTIAPVQCRDVDIGEAQPVKCLNNGLWLCREGDLPYVVVLSSHREFNREAGTCVEIAVPVGERAHSPRVALQSSRRPCRRRDPIAAKCSRLRMAGITADDRKA